MELNFFEPFLTSRKENKIKKDLIPFIILGVVLVLIIAYTVYSFISVMFLQKSIDNIENELNKPNMISKIREVEEKEQQIKEIKSEKAFLEAVDSGINGIDTVTKSLMELVAGNVTNDLYLSEMSVNLKEISLSGLGKTRLEIAQFEYNLRATRLFENIYVENIRYNEEQDAYEFNMKMSAKSDIYYKNDSDDKKAGDR